MSTRRHPTLEQDSDPLMTSVIESWKGKRTINRVRKNKVSSRTNSMEGKSLLERAETAGRLSVMHQWDKSNWTTGHRRQQRGSGLTDMHKTRGVDMLPCPFPGFCRASPQVTWTAWPRSAGQYVKFMDGFNCGGRELAHFKSGDDRLSMFGHSETSTEVYRHTQSTRQNGLQG